MLVAGDDFITAAVITKLGAERDMNIQRQFIAFAIFNGRQQVLFGECVIELQCRWVRGITGTAVVILFDHRLIPANLSGLLQGVSSVGKLATSEVCKVLK